MINYLFYKFQRPEKGWDPIPEEYAQHYANRAFTDSDTPEIIDDIVNFTGDLTHKKVLDLGAGPGHITAGLVTRGAEATWHDISHRYLQLFKKRFPHITAKTEIGYLEEARGQYDVIINRVCWYYCMNDKKFARHIFNLLKPGGKAYLVVNNKIHPQNIKFNRQSTFDILRYQINEYLGIKIGHPFISTRRLKHIFAKLPFNFISFTTKDVVTIIKLQK
jgi:2-polyprenyl-3-methyl-5-hydroxy-6-metoxy-1,4-benzoquinol methylase